MSNHKEVCRNCGTCHVYIRDQQRVCLDCGYASDLMTLEEAKTQLAQAKAHYDEVVAGELQAVQDKYDKAEAENKRLHNAVDQQREAFLKWSALVLAVTTAANIQTCPPISHAIHCVHEWQDGLNKAEQEALSQALDIAAKARHGDQEEAAEAAREPDK